MKHLLDKLEQEGILSQAEFVTLLEQHTPELAEEVFRRARAKRHQH